MASSTTGKADGYVTFPRAAMGAVVKLLIIDFVHYAIYMPVNGYKYRLPFMQTHLPYMRPRPHVAC